LSLKCLWLSVRRCRGMPKTQRHLLPRLDDDCVYPHIVTPKLKNGYATTRQRL